MILYYSSLLYCIIVTIFKLLCLYKLYLIILLLYLTMLCCCICVSTICAIKEIVNITYVINNIQNLLSVILKLTLFGVANEQMLEGSWACSLRKFLKKNATWCVLMFLCIL